VQMHLKSDLCEQLWMFTVISFTLWRNSFFAFFSASSTASLFSSSCFLSTMLLSQHLPVLILLLFHFEEIMPPVLHHGLKFLDAGLDIILEKHDVIVIMFSKSGLTALSLQTMGILHKKLVDNKNLIYRTITYHGCLEPHKTHHQCSTHRCHLGLVSPKVTSEWALISGWLPSSKPKRGSSSSGLRSLPTP